MALLDLKVGEGNISDAVMEVVITYECGQVEVQLHDYH